MAGGLTEEDLDVVEVKSLLRCGRLLGSSLRWNLELRRVLVRLLLRLLGRRQRESALILRNDRHRQVLRHRWSLWRT